MQKRNPVSPSLVSIHRGDVQAHSRLSARISEKSSSKRRGHLAISLVNFFGHEELATRQSLRKWQSQLAKLLSPSPNGRGRNEAAGGRGQGAVSSWRTGSFSCRKSACPPRRGIGGLGLRKWPPLTPDPSPEGASDLPYLVEGPVGGCRPSAYCLPARRAGRRKPMRSCEWIHTPEEAGLGRFSKF
jgi:hypothetical protein